MQQPDTHEELHPNEPIEVKNARRLSTAEQVAQFLAGGGTIQIKARGESGIKRKTGMQPMIYGDAPDNFRR